MPGFNAVRGLTGAWRAAQKAANVKPSRLNSSAAPATAATTTSSSGQQGGQPPTEVTVMDNGLRVASEDSGSPTSTVGLWFDAGSKSETASNNGASHFLEHMAFKGTAKRTQSQLEQEVAKMGAQLQARTSREQMCFYIKCLTQDVPSAVELLADCVVNPKLEEQAIERERGAILREMAARESNLHEVVFDHLHAVAYQGTPLGRTISGPTGNVKSLTRDDLTHYMGANLKAPRAVLAGAGGVAHGDLCKLAEQHLGKLNSDVTSNVPLDVHCRFSGGDVRVRDDAMPFSHVALAVEGCGWTNPDNVPLMVTAEIIGSWDSTMGGGDQCASNLAKYCAQHRFAKQFQSFNLNYKDSGLWGVYFVCDSMNHENFIFNAQQEWMRLCTEATDFEVERAKNQLKSNLMLRVDGGSAAAAEDIGTQMLAYGRRIPMAEMEARIDAVDASLVRDVCYRYIYDRCPAVAGVGPVEELLDYNRIRSGMYWFRV